MGERLRWHRLGDRTAQKRVDEIVAHPFDNLFVLLGQAQPGEDAGDLAATYTFGRLPECARWPQSYLQRPFWAVAPTRSNRFG